jgi:subtilisin family serine protease
VQYITFTDRTDDTVNGHGTHVAGSIAGNIANFADASSPDLSQFNGLAPNAKLAVFDSGSSTGTFLRIPSNLNMRVFGAAYTAGARVHANAWSANVLDNSYSSTAQKFDQFTYV